MRLDVRFISFVDGFTKQMTRLVVCRCSDTIASNVHLRPKTAWGGAGARRLPISQSHFAQIAVAPRYYPLSLERARSGMQGGAPDE